MSAQESEGLWPAGAEEKARALISTLPVCSLAQATAVFEVLECDAAHVTSLLGEMTEAERARELKRLKVALHPDKNKHPRALEAFQRAGVLFA